MKHLMEMARLIEEAGLGIVGETLFIGTMPPEAVNCIMLRDPLTGIEIDDGMKNFFTAEVTVIVRDTNVGLGYDKALAVSSVLSVDDLETPDIVISWMKPTTLPITYPRGDANDLETSFRVRIGWGHKV